MSAINTTIVRSVFTAAISCVLSVSAVAGSPKDIRLSPLRVMAKEQVRSTVKSSVEQKSAGRRTSKSDTGKSAVKRSGPDKKGFEGKLRRTVRKVSVPHRYPRNHGKEVRHLHTRPTGSSGGSGIHGPSGGVPSSGNTRLPRAAINRYIEGRISVSNCHAAPRNVSIRVSGAGRNRLVPAQHDLGGSFGFRYRIDDLPAGIFTVTPSLRGISCPGGSWTSSGASVDLSRTLHARRDFSYSVEILETRLEPSFVASVIENVFSGTVIRLNNYQRSHADDWLRPNDAFIQLPAAAGGERRNLILPAFRSGAFRYFVKDINLQRVAAQMTAEGLRLRFIFEERDVELKGHCWGTDFAIDLECPVGSDDTAPDIDLDDFHIDVLLTPARFTAGAGTDAGISYADAHVRVGLSADINGVCDVWFCGSLESFLERQVKGQVARMLGDVLDSRTLRSRVASALRPVLTGLGIGNVQEVRVERGRLVIRHLASA